MRNRHGETPLDLAEEEPVQLTLMAFRYVIPRLLDLVLSFIRCDPALAEMVAAVVPDDLADLVLR